MRIQRWHTWVFGAAAAVLVVAGCSDDDALAPDGAGSGPILTTEPFAFRMTGGGRVDDPAAQQKNAFYEPGVCSDKSFATFGFNAGPKQDGTLHGQIEWVDHCRKWNIHGYGVDQFTATSGDGRPKSRGCAVWEGPARFNGAEGYRYRVEPACDEGEPGWRDPNDPSDPPDWIAIELRAADGTVIYLRHGALTGGNIQTHPVH
jgi:hypothetical protein